MMIKITASHVLEPLLYIYYVFPFLHAQLFLSQRLYRHVVRVLLQYKLNALHHQLYRPLFVLSSRNQAHRFL